MRDGPTAARATVERPMKAVILAGGEGTRLRPLTSNQPKPMMPVANRPMMEHIVRLLADHGFDEIVVTVAFLANQIRTYFGDGAELGVEMRYATEDTPLGTAGSVRNAADELDDTFLVIAGDVLTDIDLTELVEAHKASGALGTIALKRVEDPVEFGIVITAEDGRSSGSSRSPRGARCSATPSTPASTCSSRASSTTSRRARSSTSRATCSRPRSRRASSSAGTSSTATGRTSARSPRTCSAHQDILDGKVTVDIDGFTHPARTCGSARAPRSTRTRVSTVPRSSGRTAASRPVPTSATTRSSVATSW